MLQSSDIVLDEYAVSSSHGFLPTDLPVSRLPHAYYEPWEKLADDLPELIGQKKIQGLIDSLPVLTTTWLQTEPEWRRAYSILGFLTHAYVWGGEQPKDILPPCISRPFLDVCEHLGLPPCATYAGLALWNYTTTPGVDITNPDNVSTITSFTGTRDEEWFMVISVAIEAKGGKLVTLMLDAIQAATEHDIPRLTALLCHFADVLQDITGTLKRMYDHNAPDVFFYQLRPFLAGSKNMQTAGLPNGLFYDMGDGCGEWRQYSGGSNAQSSLIQTFDIFLGVSHTATGSVKSSGPGYIQQMRDYMPVPHKRFLETLTEITNIRSYVLTLEPESPAKEAYNAAVQSLTSFRDVHVQIVSNYIIVPARNSKVEDQPAEKVNLATASTQVDGLNDKNATGLYGTGGTSLIPFLKQTRDDTKRATC